MTKCDVVLDETGGEANGAAYLVHMLLTQKAEADRTGRFAREATRLGSVGLFLRDTGEGAVVARGPEGLIVSSGVQGAHPTRVTAESRHVIDVTKVALAGRYLIVGPLTDRNFWGLVGDLVRRRVVIKGLLTHYLNTMRFLWLVNLRNA